MSTDSITVSADEPTDTLLNLNVTHQPPATDPLPSLGEHIALVVQQYLDNLGDETPSDLYALMLSQFEPPLLRVLLTHTHGNQSQVAAMLGMNRGTLRKKLRAYGLLN